MLGGGYVLHLCEWHIVRVDGFLHKQVNIRVHEIVLRVVVRGILPPLVVFRSRQNSNPRNGKSKFVVKLALVHGLQVHVVFVEFAVRSARDANLS